MAAPILVTGSHRAGTTWVGHLLGASGETAYIHEPFNVRYPGCWLQRRPRHWYMYVCADNEAEFIPSVDRLMARRFPLTARVREIRRVADAKAVAKQFALGTAHRLRRGRRLLVKDPIALYATPWLAARYGFMPVIVIRHPAGFVSSLQRLGWPFGFWHLAKQDLLLRDLLGPYEADIRSYTADERDLIDQGALLWRVLYHAVDQWRAEHPDWAFVRQEDLAANPEDGFRSLYEHLGLRFDDKARAAVIRHSLGAAEVDVSDRHSITRSGAEVGSIWHARLSPDDIERVRQATADVAPAFYDEASWALV